MRGAAAYLDSSVILKRYVREAGSEMVRGLYLKAYSGEATIAYSMWNIGEVLGALDRAARLGRLSSMLYRVVRGRFLSETIRMAKLGVLLLLPVRSRILIEAWRILEKHHVYEADALQVASAKYVGAESLLTGDRRLAEVAEAEGLNGVYVG